MVCGFNDGTLCAWRLVDRRLLAEYEPAASPIACLALNDTHLIAGTSSGELLMYLPPRVNETDSVKVNETRRMSDQI